MRVVYVARSRPGSWKNDVRDALLALGHEVVWVDDTADAASWVTRAGGADVLLWARTHRRDPAGDVDAAFGRLRAAGVRTASLHFDLYYGLRKRQAEIGIHPFWAAQTVWTADGHHRDWTLRGVRHRWCPPALGDNHIGRGEHRRELSCDVVFVGARHYHREWPYRAQLVSWLEQTYRRGFRWYGPRSPHGEVRGPALADLYASAAVVVGDACNPGFGVGRYWSDRLPITLGRGGFLVHPHVEGMADQGFIDGKTVATYRYGDFAGLRAAINRWLDDPTGRRAVTDRALQLVADRHLMTHRVQTILEETTGD